MASAGGAPQTVAHLSDRLARDWQLSPDGGRLAYLAQTQGAGLAAHVLDLSTGRVTAPFAAADAAQFHPTWEHDGSLTIGVLGEGGSAGALSLQLGDGGAAAVESLPGTTGGIDVPLSWSPGGEHLVVRAFEGNTTADPGPSRVVVLDPAGERRPLSPLSDVAVAGWLVSLG